MRCNIIKNITNYKIEISTNISIEFKMKCIQNDACKPINYLIF